jgi:hypothetical protein
MESRIPSTRIFRSTKKASTRYTVYVDDHNHDRAGDVRISWLYDDDTSSTNTTRVDEGFIQNAVLTGVWVQVAPPANVRLPRGV